MTTCRGDKTHPQRKKGCGGEKKCSKTGGEREKKQVSKTQLIEKVFLKRQGGGQKKNKIKSIPGQKTLTEVPARQTKTTAGKGKTRRLNKQNQLW